MLQTQANCVRRYPSREAYRWSLLALLQSRGRDLSHSFSLQWRLLRWTELLTQRRVIERAWWRLTFWRVAVVAASRVSLTPQCAVSRPAARARTRGKVGRAGRERGLRRCRAGCCARSRTRLNVPATSPVTGRLLAGWGSLLVADSSQRQRFRGGARTCSSPSNQQEQPPGDGHHIGGRQDVCQRASARCTGDVHQIAGYAAAAGAMMY